MILRGTIRQLVRADPPRAPSSDTPLTSDPPPARPDVDALCGPLMLLLRRLVTHVPVVTEVFLMVTIVYTHCVLMHHIPHHN